METFFEEYAEIKKQIKLLEDKESFLKKAILSELEKNKVDKVDTSYGKFTIAKRKNWIYSDKVAELKEKVKLTEIEEQENGVAKVETTSYLMFKENK